VLARAAQIVHTDAVTFHNESEEIMAYVDTLRPYEQDPQALEQRYREARSNGQIHEFAQAVRLLHAEASDQPLLQAWFYRLAENTEESRPQNGPNWQVAIGLSLFCGIIFWYLSDFDFFVLNNAFPLFALAAAPISALFILTFLYAAQPLRTSRQLQQLLLLGVLLAGGVAYVAYVGPSIATTGNQDSYLILAVPHLALLAWVAIGTWLLWTKATASDHFAFLLKSFETVVVGGLFVLAGGLFTAITVGLLETLGISADEWLMRIIIIGGGGLIPVLAVALTYDPKRAPQEQSFQAGISQLITTLMRLMLPLVLLLLVVYIGLIPLNFRQPFQNREVLIVYNLLLFAVIGLLISATPLAAHGLRPGQVRWLRRGLVSLAGLAVLISVYALTAIGYRTWMDGFTPNRLTIIGWNLFNIGLLTLLLIRQSRSDSQSWLPALYSTFAQGAKVYLVWAVAVLLLLPWVFMWASEPIKLWR